PLGEELVVEVVSRRPAWASGGAPALLVNVVSQLLDKIADQGGLVVLVEEVPQFVAEIWQAQQRRPGGGRGTDQVERCQGPVILVGEGQDQRRRQRPAHLERQAAAEPGQLPV